MKEFMIGYIAPNAMEYIQIDLGNFSNQIMIQYEELECGYIKITVPWKDGHDHIYYFDEDWNELICEDIEDDYEELDGL